MTLVASMQAARGGMWEASARFAESAAKVAEAGLARPAATADVPPEAPAAGLTPSPLGVDLPAELVIQRMAQHQWQANLTSYRTADDMIKSVIDIIT